LISRTTDSASAFVLMALIPPTELKSSKPSLKNQPRMASQDLNRYVTLAGRGVDLDRILPR